MISVGSYARSTLSDRGSGLIEPDWAPSFPLPHPPQIRLTTPGISSTLRSCARCRHPLPNPNPGHPDPLRRVSSPPPPPPPTRPSATPISSANFSWRSFKCFPSLPPYAYDSARPYHRTAVAPAPPPSLSTPTSPPSFPDSFQPLPPPQPALLRLRRHPQPPPHPSRICAYAAAR